MRSLLALAILLVTVPPGAAADEKGHSGDTQDLHIAKLRLSPERLVLGETRTAVLRVSVPAALAANGKCSDVQLQTNTGEMGVPHPVGPGLFEAEYTLPAEYHPQFALVIVRARCGGRTVIGALSHPLHGSGQVAVRSTPFSEVTLVIAEQQYGPVTADGAGHATVNVVVPPGVTTGVAGDKIIELPLPPLKRVVALFEPALLSTDNPDGATVWIHAVHRTGEPLSRPDFQIVPERGRVESIEQAAPGIFRARYRAPIRVGDGRDTVRIIFPDDEAAGETVEMAVRPGLPKSIASKIEPTRYAAGSNEPITVVVRLYDANGNLTVGTLSATSDLGTLQPLPASVAGEFRWQLSLPDRFGDKANASIRIAVQEGEKAESVVAVPLAAAPPVAVRIVKPPEPVVLDGFAPVPVRVEATDRFGNPVRDVYPTLEAESGTFSPPVAEDAGFTANYTPDLKQKAETVRIVAKAGSARSEVTLLLVPGYYRAALTPEVGFFSNFGNLQAPLFTAIADLSLRRLLPGLRVGAAFNYFFSRESGSALSVDSTIHCFPLFVHAGYDRNLAPRWRLGTDLGLGTLVVRHTLAPIDGSYAFVENAARFGLSLGIVGAFRTALGCVTLRLRWLYGTKISEKTFSGSLSGIGITAGWSFLI